MDSNHGNAEIRMLVLPKGTSSIAVAAPHPALQSSGDGGGESVIFEPCQKPQLGTCRAMTVTESGNSVVENGRLSDHPLEGWALTVGGTERSMA